jgi:hypothetical protein
MNSKPNTLKMSEIVPDKEDRDFIKEMLTNPPNGKLTFIRDIKPNEDRFSHLNKTFRLRSDKTGN